MLIVFFITLFIQLFFYNLFYDRTIYQIDNVEAWMVRFLYFYSELIGFHFKKNYSFINKVSRINLLLLIVSLSFYLFFALNIRNGSISTEYQTFSPFLLVFLMANIVYYLISLESFFLKDYFQFYELFYSIFPISLLKYI